MNTTMIKSSSGLIIGFVLLLMMSGSAKAGPFIGINYGPFHKAGQHPGKTVPDSQFMSDLSILSQKFNYIKTYGDDAPSGLNRVVPIASSQFPQLKVYQGVFEDPTYNGAGDKTYLNTAINLANTYPKTVVAVVVGNECLPGDPNPKPITVKQLIADLQYVRARLKNKTVQVTTGLTYQAALKYGDQLRPYVDSIMVNIYPFFGPVAIDKGISNLIGAYDMFKMKFNGKEVIIGETGWPSAGKHNGPAVPSVANEGTYIRANFANANRLGSDFLFEAFDEPWKTDTSWGPYWGLWNTDGKAKFSFH